MDWLAPENGIIRITNRAEQLVRQAALLGAVLGDIVTLARNQPALWSPLPPDAAGNKGIKIPERKLSEHCTGWLALFMPVIYENIEGADDWLSGPTHARLTIKTHAGTVPDEPGELKNLPLPLSSGAVLLSPIEGCFPEASGAGELWYKGTHEEGTRLDETETKAVIEVLTFMARE